MRKTASLTLFEVQPGRRGAAFLPAPDSAVEAACAALDGDWVPSRFNVAVDLPGRRKAVYNAFTGALTVMNHGLWRQAFAPGRRHRLAGERGARFLRPLVPKGFFVPEGTDELERVRLKFQGDRHAADSFTVNLLPTLGCNLRCSYCFQGRAQLRRAGERMSRDTEHAVVRFLERSIRGRKKLNVVWFGGEPLLSLDTIERISAYLGPLCRRAQVACGAVVVTNGVLLGRDAVRRLAACRVEAAQVTVDIPAASKRDRLGRDTLDRVLDNLTFAARRLDVFLRINLVADDRAEFDRLYDALARRKLAGKLKAIMFAHVFQPECGRSGRRFRSLPPEGFVAAVRRERARAKARGLPVETTPLARGSACAATLDGSAVIGPDGLLYKCVEDAGLPDRAWGSVYLDYPARPTRLAPWLSYDWFGHKECRDCPVLPECGGGCPHKRLFERGRLKGRDFCYWHILGDLESRIREHALHGLAGLAGKPGRSARAPTPRKLPLRQGPGRNPQDPCASTHSTGDGPSSRKSCAVSSCSVISQ